MARIVTRISNNLNLAANIHTWVAPLPLDITTVGIIASRGTLNDPALQMKVSIDLSFDAGKTWQARTSSTFVGGAKPNPRTGLDFTEQAQVFSVDQPTNPGRQVRVTLENNKRTRFTIDVVTV